MQQTISENFIYNLSDTLSVSCILSEDSAFLSVLFLRGFNYYVQGNYLFRVNYSTSNIEICSNSLESKSKKVYTLNPYFITGFFDAESSFMLSLIKDSNHKTGLKLTFSVVLHKKDIMLLESIKSALGGIGNISNHVNGVQFRVRSNSELEVLIKFLDKFALITQKRSDFQNFKEAFEIYSKKLHLKTEGLNKLFGIKAILNKGTSQFSNEEASFFFKEISLNINSIKPMPRPVVMDKIIKSSHWLAGFTSGDGGFYIQIQENKVSLKFYISQHQRNKALLESLISYLGCGRVESSNNLNVFVVIKFIEINEKIIPLFKEHFIHGEKSKDFKDFCEAASLIKVKNHLNQKGLNKLKEIKLRMNRNRTFIDNKNDNPEIFNPKIKQKTINLLKRDYSSLCTSKVKILLNMNNPQVTKASNSQVGTSETIRLLNINTNSRQVGINKK
jgi:hypothetical protein